MRFLAATILLFCATPAYAEDTVTLTVEGSPHAAVEHEVPSVTLGSISISPRVESAMQVS